MVTWNTDIAGKDTEQYGEKAAYLADLAANGFSVPTFFTLSTADVQSFLADAVPRQHREHLHETADWNTLQQRATDIQQQIQEALLPPDMENAVTTAYTDIGLSKAVRNTNKEAKDLVAQRDFEFVSVRPSTTSRLHGLCTPLLCVNGKEDVVDAVKQVIANFYAADSIHYQNDNGETRLAVMVQRMLTPDHSCSIYVGTDHIIVEAVPGFGDTLLHGALTPDRYIIDADTGAIQHETVVQKPWKRIQHPETGRLTKETVSQDQQNEPVLDTDMLREAVSLARKATSALSVNRVDLSYDGSKFHVLDAYTATAPPNPHPETEDDTTQGTPAASGTATGPATANTANPGIYTTADATPAYTPFHTQIQAVLTEHGGITSHLAELCRLNQVPCIINIGGVTDRFPPDTTLTVDADTGSIHESPRTDTKQELAASSTVLPATQVYVENPDDNVTADGIYLSASIDQIPDITPVWNAATTQEGIPVLPATSTDPEQAQGKPVLFQHLSDFQQLEAFRDAAAFILDIPVLEQEANDPSYVSQAIQHAATHRDDQELAAVLHSLDEARIQELVNNGFTTLITPPALLSRARLLLHRAEQRYILRELRDNR